jgi:D-alanyl-D-alanine carboxypeptidase
MIKRPAGRWLRRRHHVRGMACVAAVLATLSLGGWSSLTAAGARQTQGSTVQAALQSELNRYLSTQGSAEHISAVSLRVTFRGNQPSINLTAGTTRYGGGAPASSRAVWQIGSNTKAFTSVILLQLEAEGKVSVNDTVGQWLPQYPQWRDITIKRLLNMTSGIPDAVDQPAFLRAFAADPDTVFSLARLVSYAYGLPLGKDTYRYSNTDYQLIQLIIQKATHDSFADQLTRRIIIPLGLRTVCLAPYTCPASAAARMPAGYYFMTDIPQMQALEGTPMPKLNLTSSQGSGDIVSSLRDMTTWDRALYRGELLPQAQQRQLESLVSTKTGRPIQRTTLSDPSGYGLGVAQATSKVTGTVWAYEGETFGYRVQHVYFPGTGLIIALAVNSSTDGDNDQLAALALSVYQVLQKAADLTS